MREREIEWTELMQLAIAGDGTAYHRLLTGITPVLRATTEGGLERAGYQADQCERIVQEILLAVHLKRHTWDASVPFCSWLFAITRKKLLDVMPQRDRYIPADIESFAVPSPDQPPTETLKLHDIDGHIQSLRQPQRSVLQLIIFEGASVREAAAMLMTSEDAALVALHRGLSKLANKMRQAGANRLK